MKKAISIILAGLLVAICSVSVMADNTEFIEYCRENYTVVDIESETGNISVSEVEKLWDDRSIVSEDELIEAQNYNSANEDKMYYSIKLKVLNQEPGINTVGYDPTTGKEDHNVYASENIERDAGFSKLFDENLDACMNIENADNVWCFVSIEKHLIRTHDEQLVSAACSSNESYAITLGIPSYYKGCNDLRLAKLSGGQVTYIDGINSEAESFTTTTNGSAIFVFSGTRIKTEDSNKGEIDIGRPVAGTLDTETELSDNDNSDQITSTNPPADINNNSGQVTAPQTADINNPTVPTILIMIGATALIVLKRTKEMID